MISATSSVPAHRPILQVDLGAVSHNLALVRSRRPGAEAAPVVKADAYGVGLGPIVRHLTTKDAVRTFCVAYAAEAQDVRHALGTAPADAGPVIYCLNGYAPGEAAQYTDAGIRPVLATAGQIAGWQGRGGGMCGLAIDIGMHRLGLSLAEAMGLPAAGFDAASVAMIEMHLSHAAEPDAPANDVQLARFVEYAVALRQLYPSARMSLSASGAISFRADVAETMTRPGVVLYGVGPVPADFGTLRPATSLAAPIVSLRHVETGETVGYSGRWRASAPSTIAIIQAGYADGIMRSLGNKGAVLVAGVKCPIIGAVSMDLTAVDVSAVAGAKLGDLATFWGEDLRIEEVAAAAETIPYELLARLGHRVERRYMAPEAAAAPISSA